MFELLGDVDVFCFSAATMLWGDKAWDQLYFWLDYTSLRQNAAGGVALQQLANVIKLIGNTVLIVEPWDGPNALQRIWCLFEVGETSPSSYTLVYSNVESRMRQEGALCC